MRSSRYQEEGRLPRLQDIDEDTAKTIRRIRKRMAREDDNAYFIGALINPFVRAGVAIGKAVDTAYLGTRQLIADTSDYVRYHLPAQQQVREAIAGAAIVGALLTAPVAQRSAEGPQSAYIKDLEYSLEH